MIRSVETVLFLVVVATLVAAFANRLRLPAPSLLVVAGLVVGLLPGVPAIEVTPDLVSLIVLPPLLFAAGEELPWRELRSVWRPVTVLSVGLVLVSAAAVALLATLLTPLPFGLAFVLGAVLASTDPVAVTALGRRLALPPRIQTLVQAESLFNDATSLLLFRVALAAAVATTTTISASSTLTLFAVLAGGGILVGGLTAVGAYLVRRRTEDPVLETVICLVTPYAAYVLAESTGASGVTAVVVASVILGTQARKLTTARIRLQLDAVFRTVVFLLESVIFGLIGLQLPALVQRLAGSQPWWPLQAAAIAVTLIIVRMLWVFPLAALARRGNPQGRLSWQVPAVVSWAGARGVVPLAAALSIPLLRDDGTPLPYRDLVLVLTIAVIVLTLIVQGFTLAPLVERTGIALTARHINQENADTRIQLARAALAYLDDIRDSETVSDAAITALRHTWQNRLQAIQAETDNPTRRPEPATYRQLRHDLIAFEAAELDRLHKQGTVSDSTRRRIQHRLDIEQAGLAEDL